MKIILSRKGFDSIKDKKDGLPKYGGHPSPILTNGKMLSLPIPLQGESLSYDAITAPSGKSYAEIIEELGAGEYIGSKHAHSDPDLVESAQDRRLGWRPAFGQCETAGKHLDNHCVSEGDLFLFFGWFQHTEEVGGRLRYQRNDEGFHAIFGYMQIGEIISSNAEVERRRWLHNHPHAKLKWANDRIYVTSSNLSLYPTYPGGGVFHFDERHRLTKLGESKSRWNLDPKVFRHVKITYHPKPEKVWTEGYFQSKSPGQEFVIYADEGVIQWATNLIKNSRLWSD